MTYQKSQGVCTEHQLATLQQALKDSENSGPVLKFFGVCLLVFAGCCVFFGIRDQEWRNVVPLIFSVLVGVSLLRQSPDTDQRVRRDVQSRKKEIIRATLLQKEILPTEPPQYRFHIQHDILEVSDMAFNTCPVGLDIVIERACCSRIIFSIKRV